ncbi:hypothetical protein G9A89_020827 [Geosiphon pyriformis]|nr:hypothetical protein G9A89_020827 [Geosiphon pyriformis]
MMKAIFQKKGIKLQPMGRILMGGDPKPLSDDHGDHLNQGCHLGVLVTTDNGTKYLIHTDPVDVRLVDSSAMTRRWRSFGQELDTYASPTIGNIFKTAHECKELGKVNDKIVASTCYYVVKGVMDSYTFGWELLAEFVKEINGNKKENNNSKKEINSSKKEIDSSKKEINSSKKEISITRCQTKSSKANEWLNKSIDDRHVKLIDYSDFEQVETIQGGAFGDVIKAMWKSLQYEVAIKIIKPLERKSSIELLVSEIQLLQKVGYHHHIVSFCGVSKIPNTDEYCIVMKYANGGTLKSFLEKNSSNLTWQRRIKIATEIALGLCCIHKEGIAHRDLHHKNVLLDDGKWVIADFGISRYLEVVSIDQSKSIIGGIAAYTEPKFLNDLNNYIRDKRSDIFSFGVLMWEISSGVPPFRGLPKDVVAYKAITGEREKPIPGTPPEYMQLYQRCWDEQPEQRPSIEEVLKALVEMSENSNVKRSHDIIIVDEKFSTKDNFIYYEPINDEDSLPSLSYGAQFQVI